MSIRRFTEFSFGDQNCKFFENPNETFTIEQVNNNRSFEVNSDDPEFISMVFTKEELSDLFEILSETLGKVVSQPIVNPQQVIYRNIENDGASIDDQPAGAKMAARPKSQFSQKFTDGAEKYVRLPGR